MSTSELRITAHCLLRLSTALMLEVADIPHGLPSATSELNRRTGRNHSSREWLDILEPRWRRLFCPGDDHTRLA
jgi:hypothetical protein